MEGIETDEQLNAMRGWKVHLVQGYLFSAPKTIEVIVPLLRARRPFPTLRLMSPREQIRSLGSFINEPSGPAVPLPIAADVCHERHESTPRERSKRAR